MRQLFLMDRQDYAPDAVPFVRPSVRGIILRGNRVAMVHSQKYDYYKFPGGGMEPGESRMDSLIREVEEESGLRVIPSSVREYGVVPRKEKSDTPGMVFVQDNFYYLCDTEELPGQQKLDDYEAEERFTLEFVEPAQAIRVNRYADHGPKDQQMLEREALVLECLIREKYL